LTRIRAKKWPKNPKWAPECDSDFSIRVLLVRNQVPEADGGQRDEAEVRAVEEGPAFPVLGKFYDFSKYFFDSKVAQNIRRFRREILHHMFYTDYTICNSFGEMW
jgi:hypothetical protein